MESMLLLLARVGVESKAVAVERERVFGPRNVGYCHGRGDRGALVADLCAWIAGTGHASAAGHSFETRAHLAKWESDSPPHIDWSG